MSVVVYTTSSEITCVRFTVQCTVMESTYAGSCVAYMYNVLVLQHLSTHYIGDSSGPGPVYVHVVWKINTF